tara:strand:+ start:18822 stop:19979 length:1158 start_codon:yes stop_codon:yes gene_type:complete
MIDILTQKYDRKLLIYFSILAVLGTVMLYSASWYESFANSNGRTDMLFLQNHLKRLLLGIICLFIFLILDYRHLKNVAIYMIIGSIFLLLLTKISYLAKGLGWSKPARWIYFGPFSIQTSDIARMSVIVYMAYYVDKKREKLHDFYTGFFPAICLLTIIMALIVIQPDFSTAAMIGTLGTVILFIGGVKISQLSLISTSGLLIGIPILLSREYRRQRVLSWFGFADLPDVGYQAKQSLISLGNGGIFGVGLGNSIEKNQLLPTPHTDFIFAIIGEELGFIIGSIPVITLFLLIFLRGIKISRKCTDHFGVLLAVGISFNFILYAFVNAAVVTGIFPVTGLPMPMVSYGGSGMVVNMALIGILLNISQAKRSVGRNKHGWSPTLIG